MKTSGMVLCVLLALATCTDAVAFARRFVGEGSWGVLVSLNRAGRPFGKVTSYSDAGTGTPYLYLDPAGVSDDSRGSFTLSQIEIDDCGGNDPQSPVCAKITLSGNVVMVEESSREGLFAKKALFNAHPQIGEFGKTFAVLKLIITKIFIVNKAAKPTNISVGDYLAG